MQTQHRDFIEGTNLQRDPKRAFVLAALESTGTTGVKIHVHVASLVTRQFGDQQVSPVHRTDHDRLAIAVILSDHRLKDITDADEGRGSFAILFQDQPAGSKQANRTFLSRVFNPDHRGKGRRQSLVQGHMQQTKAWTHGRWQPDRSVSSTYRIQQLETWYGIVSVVMRAIKILSNCSTVSPTKPLTFGVISLGFRFGQGHRHPAEISSASVSGLAHRSRTARASASTVSKPLFDTIETSRSQPIAACRLTSAIRSFVA